MKILIVHRYYWPDTAPAATIFRSIARRWTTDGHDVTAFSAQPDYSGDSSSAPRTERLDGSRVVRTRLLPESKSNYVARSANYGIFFAQAFLHILQSRDYDVVVALTAPPVLPGLVLRTAARLTGAALIFQCMDIFPELALESGKMKPGFRSRLLRRVDTATVNRASCTVVLSQDMRQLLIDRGADPGRLEVINNLDLNEFAEAEELAQAEGRGVEPLPAELHKPAGATQVIFAGNMGRFQGLDTVIDAAHLLADEASIRFDFYGTGVALNDMKTRAGQLVGSSVHFHDRVSSAVAARVTEQADMALVTLAPGVIRAAYPSKTITCLRAGTPIVAMVESDSELGQMVSTEGLGAVVEPGDAAGLASAIRTMAPGDLATMRARCLTVYADRFEREILLSKWSALVDSIRSDRGR